MSACWTPQMLAALSRVKSPRWLSPDTVLGYILGQEVRRNEWSSFSHSSSSVSAALRRKVAGGFRDVSTSCSLCAKVRGNPKKRELSEKKLVGVWATSLPQVFLTELYQGYKQGEWKRKTTIHHLILYFLCSFLRLPVFNLQFWCHIQTVLDKIVQG